MGVFSFIVTLLFFASMEVVSKPLMGAVDPIVLTFWRFVCGASVLILFMLVSRRRVKLSLSKVLLLAAMGVLNVFVSMSLLQLAVKYTSASRAATVFGFNPVFVVLIASAMGWERFSWRKVSGLFLGIAGLVLVTGVHTMDVDSGTKYALLAAVTFASYILLGRKASTGMDPVTVNVVSFLFGLAALLIWLVSTGVSIDPTPLKTNLASFFFLGAGVSGLGYITFITAIKKLGAGNTSTIFLLKPAVATLLAIVFLHESIETAFVVGLLLAGTGSYLVAVKK